MSSIKVGTKLKSKATGAIVDVVDMDFNMYEWTYVLDILGIRRHQSYSSIIKEYDIVDGGNGTPHLGESSCTCGGLKTYNSRDKVYHSNWCVYGK
jgi:hypothetical protein